MTDRRFRQFVVASIAVLALLSAFSFVKIEGEISARHHLQTRIERVERRELCSTAVSCERLLNKLITNVSPAEKQKLARTLGITPRRIHAVAPIIANEHRHTSTAPKHKIVRTIPRLPAGPLTPSPLLRHPPKAPGTVPIPAPTSPTPSLPTPHVPTVPIPMPPKPPVISVPPIKVGPVETPPVTVEAPRLPTIPKL